MSTIQRQRLFVDSNVLIEALFLPTSAAATIIRLVADGAFAMLTCREAITDVETAILKKLEKAPEEINTVFERWQFICNLTELTIMQDPPDETVRKTFHAYLPLMRHSADITILAAALLCNPDVILSGNRQHFNNAVAKKCGVPIFSCAEFIGSITAD